VVSLMIGTASGCGGDDGGGGQTSAPPASTTVYYQPPVPVPLGVLGGKLARQNNPDLVFVVRDHWTQLLFYGITTARGLEIAGFIASGGDWWTSVDPTVYNGQDWWSGEKLYLQATHDVGVPSLEGTIRYGSGATTTFSGGPVPGSTYDYNAHADVGSVVGNWVLMDTKGQQVAVDIKPDGSVSGQERCAFSGRIEPDPGGKNILRLRFTMPCLDPQGLSAYDGFVLSFPMDSGTTQLLLYAESGNGMDWLALIATGLR
jgi:hypothetical protein